MPTVTVKHYRESKNLCGFCANGNRHDLCPGGILNGDGETIVLCACTQHALVMRCLGCGLRSNTEISADTWTCLDAEACNDRQTTRHEKAFRELFGDPEGPEAIRTRATSREAAGSPGKAGGTCLCCGDPTKGGLFLPGHDSRFLSSCVAKIKEGTYDLENTLTAWAAAGISESLQNKLRKRVA